jgi:hypothetical protein
MGSHDEASKCILQLFIVNVPIKIHTVELTLMSLIFTSYHDICNHWLEDGVQDYIFKKFNISQIPNKAIKYTNVMNSCYIEVEL